VLESVLQGVLLLGSILTAVRLFRTGLYRRYPFFFLYFVLRIPNSLWPLFLDTSSNTYLHVWVFTEPVFVVLYVLMVFELYRLVLEKYEGLYTLGRWAMYLFGTISLGVSALTLIPRIRPTAPQSSKILGYFFAIERGVDFSLAIFLILLLFFLALFPVKLSRNVRVHAIIYPVFFLSNTLALLMRGLFGMQHVDQFNAVFSVVSVAAMIAWLVLLSPEGEEAPAHTQVSAGHDFESRALIHLSSLNATMLRVSRQ